MKVMKSMKVTKHPWQVSDAKWAKQEAARAAAVIKKPASSNVSKFKKEIDDIDADTDAGCMGKEQQAEIRAKKEYSSLL